MHHPPRRLVVPSLLLPSIGLSLTDLEYIDFVGKPVGLPFDFRGSGKPCQLLPHRQKQGQEHRVAPSTAPSRPEGIRYSVHLLSGRAVVRLHHDPQVARVGIRGFAPPGGQDANAPASPHQVGAEIPRDRGYGESATCVRDRHCHLVARRYRLNGHHEAPPPLGSNDRARNRVARCLVTDGP